MSLPVLESRVQPRAPVLRWTLPRALPVDSAVRNALCAVAALTVLRFTLAATLPLSFDEAYYWLWSRHLALSYYENPPLIALAIRLGTLVFGDTELGVRFVPLLCSVAASWAIWRSAAIALRDNAAAATACLLFNATLMFAAEMMGATPDSLLIAAAAFLLLAIAKIEETHDGRWWIAAGLSAGIALLAKYTALFLCASLVFWLLVNPRARSWLRSPWAWTGAFIALAATIPTIWWNAAHDFMSFRFQFGRMGTGHLALRFLAEFAGSQILLASPFILVLGAIGMMRHSPFSRTAGTLGFASAVIWPALAYFLVHATHDRVQGNWPCFVYPALALLAAQVYAQRATGRGMRGLVAWSRVLALPAAGAILTVAYAQAFFGVLPLGRRDPIGRMMGVGVPAVAAEVATLAAREGATAIITTNYDTTGWLSFYMHRSMPIVPITGDNRFLSSPLAGTALLTKPLLYVTQAPDRELSQAAKSFSNIRLLTRIDRGRGGSPIDTFSVYAVSAFHGAPVGRLP